MASNAEKALEILKKHEGKLEGTSEWHTVDQPQINLFADATLDRQFIHVDPELAAQVSPYKVTIAHGFLTLSLISPLLRDAIALTGLRLAINYGANRIRFVSPVAAGSRIRGRFVLGSVEDAGGAVQATWNVTVEREHSDKPCLVAEWLVRYYR